MVSTKHCCWGECKSDSRYPEKLPESLREMQESAKKIFIPFPKPSQGIDRCQRWITACSRKHFTMNSITRNTYICALHWPGEQGPTQEFPDPLKANFTPKEVKKATLPKQKAPAVRHEDVKRMKTADEVNEPEDSSDHIEGGDPLYFQMEFDSDKTNNKGTQTKVSKHELASKVETMILRNEVATAMNSKEVTKVVSSLSYEVIVKDSSLMKHFVGLTSPQFEALHNFLNDVSL